MCVFELFTLFVSSVVEKTQLIFSFEFLGTISNTLGYFRSCLDCRPFL